MRSAPADASALDRMLFPLGRSADRTPLEAFSTCWSIFLLLPFGVSDEGNGWTCMRSL
jgi:hypothetical protein